MEDMEIYGYTLFRTIPKDTLVTVYLICFGEKTR